MKDTETPDIFLWANQADAVKNEMAVSLYVFNKYGSVFTLRHNKDLTPYLRACFLYDLINTVTLGAGTGMTIRDIHNDDGKTENVVDTVALETVPRAQSIIEQIAYDGANLEEFSHDEHDIKKLAGIVLGCTPKGQKPFFIMKQLQQSKILRGDVSWSWTKNGLQYDAPAAVIEPPKDNQVLVIGEQMFIFNTTKFTNMFGYDAKRKVVMDGKLDEISKHFKLSFPDGIDMKMLVERNGSLAQALLRADPASASQDRVIDHADKFGLALMTDDSGAIIIMDGRDATIFVNLLNDDYVESDMTDRHYLAIKKKEVLATEDSQLNMGV